MAGRRNRSRGWRRPAVVLARSSAYLPSILASNAMSVRGLRGLATPTLWGAALRQRCDRNVQRPRLNLLLEHDHSPECVARALLSVPPCPPALISLETSDPALSQLAWAHLKAVEVTPPVLPPCTREVEYQEVALTSKFCYLECKRSGGECGERRWRYGGASLTSYS